MPSSRVLHYGLNRSGTNYLKELVERQLNVEIINHEGERSHPLHKHFRLYDDKTLIGRPNFNNKIVLGSFDDYEQKYVPGFGADLVIVVSKDPYSWHLSYKKWGEKNKWPPSPHPFILEYNEFYRKWIELSRETNKIIFVKYIDLLTQPSRELEKIARALHLPFEIEDPSVLRIKKVPMSKRFSPRKLRYYTEEHYIDEFSDREIHQLNELIDPEVIGVLGYQLIEPA